MEVSRNFHASIKMSDYLVETPLFKKIASRHTQRESRKDYKARTKKYFSELRGGSQGDYRMGMEENS